MAAVWGIGKALVAEAPAVSLTLVDTDGDVVVGEAPEQVWRGGVSHVPEVARVTGEPERALPTSVLVTGAFGGIGQHVCRWLAEAGVARLVLLGRRGAASPGAPALVAELSDVVVDAVDVAVRAEVAACLARVGLVDGVVHCAGVVDDGLLADQDAGRLARVLAGKVHGAQHLDALTSGLRLFTVFSSVVGTFGAPAQATYAAANAALDAIAASRVARGEVGTSLVWGPWEGVGMAAALGDAELRRWRERGMAALSLSRARSLFRAALGRPEASLILARLDLTRLAQPRVVAGWSAALDVAADRRLAVATGLVREEVARLLAVDVGRVEADKPLSSLGLDSLLALELRGGLGDQLGRAVPATFVFDHPTPAAMAAWVVAQLEPTETVAAPVRTVRADEPIAVVGFGCRFPGGIEDADTFWQVVGRGVDAIRPVPADRWDADAFYDPTPGTAGRTYGREGGFLDQVDQFDPAFFEISPREAVDMDPQQRLLLETSWEALERAGIPASGLAGRDVGVFVGVMSHEYLELQGNRPERRDGYVTTGNLGSVASGRISYQLGVRGPSMTVDTACSSSLVATHLACQALRSGECELALAGGATVVLTPSLYIEFSRLRGLSSDGRCKTFDASADGVSWSEGAGVLALKRLSDAQRDGDRIWGVIAGSAVNQDGRSQGLTAPNGVAQQAVIRRALGQAGVSAADVDYVEAHGTGTRLGDPIEVGALGTALRPDGGAPLRIGSFKSNVGHTQAAAGVGGVIKTLLAMQREQLPASLHFRDPSPHIAWDALSVEVVAEPTPWPTGERVAGVSAFGISGTNAHVVLTEPPAVPAPDRDDRAHLVVLSARTPQALAEASARLTRRLMAAPPPLADVAATLSHGREHHAHRLAVSARTVPELVDALLAGESVSGVCGEREPVAWLFTGQGAQWMGMGQGLAADWPAFAEALVPRIRSAVRVV
jgi:3-oxoacyl-(acyl-carrier-protein) synthase/NAD(P)-dependent dehydrogenase (short-subunit alcohol dehydrogenase family)/acyl carrier protein